MLPLTRELIIVAQDPSVRNVKNEILLSKVTITNEQLGLGPRGYRVQIVDYDASQRVLYKPADLKNDSNDHFTEGKFNEKILKNPDFHAQNCYAIIMRILEYFEFALGRRLTWGFGAHQIYVAPHAFADANAYYSEEDQGLFFGYFQNKKGHTIFTCLSHDIVAHETCHALLDGLRKCYTFPSFSDQAGFHEGFSDVVALLSVFGLRNIVRNLLPETSEGSNRILKKNLSVRALSKNVLFGLAKQFGKETSNFSKNALRRAVERRPYKKAMKEKPFEECHLRGEILTSAVLNTFLQIWIKRLNTWLPNYDLDVPLDRVVEDGCDAAEHLLKMVIRALDYCPVVDITFSDFLSALITADFELLPDDGKYKYRETLIEEFKHWGINPASQKPPWVSDKKQKKDRGLIPTEGAWQYPKNKSELSNDGIHRVSLEQDPDEVFKYIWENRRILGIYEDVYTKVISVRPCHRIGPDGFYIRETVSEYVQVMDMEARQLKRFKIDVPDMMPANTKVRLYGGGVLIFDEFGQLKYHVRSRINNANRQSIRLKYLWENGIKDRDNGYGINDGSSEGQKFAMMHLRRAGQIEKKEEWSE